MIQLSPGMRVFIHVDPVDFRNYVELTVMLSSGGARAPAEIRNWLSLCITVFFF